jgi:MoxR-like ATPase
VNPVSISPLPVAPAPLAAALERSVKSAIRGKDAQIRLAIVALLSKGHVLIEDVPGVGKTTLARALARAVGGSFQRIQFTSDLLPSDILGVSIYEPDSRSFSFKKGPVFANVVLADEINRTTPRTQSALLEAMGEGQVSVDGKIHVLPKPFLVAATQNPVEHHGTYPLPESQLDRFTLRIRMGYPDADAERDLIRKGAVDAAAEVPLAGAVGDLLAAQEAAEGVRVDDALVAWIQALAAATRSRKGVALGVSPRGSVHLLRASRAAAVAGDRDFVTPDDVKSLAVPVLAHRLVLAGRNAPGASDAVIEEILEQVPGPG